MAPRVDPSSRWGASRGGKRRVQAFLLCTRAQRKGSSTVVGSVPGKVSWAKTLKLVPFCDVVKRRGLGVESREVARRQNEDQDFRRGKGLASEGKCLFTKGYMENTLL